MSNSTATSPIARELAPSVDAVGDWQRLYAADTSEANLRGLMRAVRVRRQWTAEEIQAVEAFDDQRRRRHFCEHVAEHVRGDPATTDDVRAANMEDLLVRYDELFPSRGVSLDDIVRRHEWRQFDPSTPTWRIAGMMRRSGVTLFSGDPKSGKTVFGRCLSVAVSGREQVFCGLRVEPCPVIFLELDESEETVDEHFAEIAIPGADLHVLLDYGGRHLPPRSKRFAWLSEWARDIKAGIIVIDTLARFTPLGGNNAVADYGAMAGVMAEYQRLAVDSAAHIVILHHTAKHEGRPTPLGSQAFGGGVDALWTLTRSGDTRYLAIDGRGVSLPKTEIRFEDGWTTFGLSREVQERRDRAAEIMATIEARPGELTRREIPRAVGMNNAECSKILQSLVREGRLHYAKPEGRRAETLWPSTNCSVFQPYRGENTEH